MLAVILTIVVGTIRLIGSHADNVFSSVGSAIQWIKSAKQEFLNLKTKPLPSTWQGLPFYALALSLHNTLIDCAVDCKEYWGNRGTPIACSKVSEIGTPRGVAAYFNVRKPWKSVPDPLWDRETPQPSPEPLRKA
jgi:hypothetical protein